MVLIEDTRQQKQKHEQKHKDFADLNVSLTRSKLPYGDYSLPPKKAVDTKADIAEIAQNICGSVAEHKRFIDECKAAKNDGCKLFILVENLDGIDAVEDLSGIPDVRSEYNPNKYMTRPIPGSQLAKAMRTIEARYGCSFLFCRPDEAAEMIIDLLR